MTPPIRGVGRGKAVAKTKKKKKDKPGKAASGGKASKITKRLEELSNNRFVADIVAAALVATASALKDSKKAKALAASAGDELENLAKEGAERGNAMWKLALEVGRRAIDTIAGDEAKPANKPKAKAAKAAKPAKAKPAKAKPASKSGRKPK
jgi:hypothetical protein